MIMADTLAIVFAVLGFLLALPGLWLLCRGLWPRAVQNTTDDCSRGLLFPFLAGLPITAIALVLTIIVSKSLGGASGLGSLFVICFFVLFASVGIAGLTTSIGMKLPSPADRERPWQATIRGSVVLELAFLLPILGWFIILPSALIVGSGSALRSIIKNIRAKGGQPGLINTSQDMAKNIAEKSTKESTTASTTESTKKSTKETRDLGLSGTIGAA